MVGLSQASIEAVSQNYGALNVIIFWSLAGA